MTVKKVAVALLVVGAAIVVGGGPASAGGGCYGGPPTDRTGTSVDAVENCFQATVLRVAPGTTVTWTNRDSYAHTVTGVGFTWGSGDDLRPGHSVDYTFDDPGIYVYSCLIHPGMAGAVVVGDGGSASGAGVVASGPVSASPAASTTQTKHAPADARDSGSVATRVLLGGLAGLVVGIGTGFAIRRRRASSSATPA